MKRSRKTLGEIAAEKMRRGSETENRRVLDALRKLAGHPALYDEPAPATRTIATRQNSERRHQNALRQAAWSRWWAPGFAHHRQEALTDADRLAGWRGGVAPGWPDCTLHIPRRGRVGGVPPVMAACELKAPSAGPKRHGRLSTAHMELDWWLTWLRELPERDELDARADRTHYGLRESQARRLRDLRGCGYRVLIAWDWRHALAWFDTLAGPRPDEMPEGW